MFKKVVTEGKRTFFLGFIHAVFLLLIDDNLFEKGTAVNVHISGVERVFAILNYHAYYFMCQVFVPYVGFAVVAIQYYFFICACLDWLFPRPKADMRRGVFGEFDSCTYQEAKDLVHNLKQVRTKYLKKYLFSQFGTCLTPTDIVYLKTVHLESLSKFEAEFRPSFCHPNVSALFMIYDPRNDSALFGTTYDDDTLSLVIFNEKFCHNKKFFMFAMKWTSDIVKGIQYLHDKKIYHLNLQPENILIEFGSKDFVPLSSKAIVGNFNQMQRSFDKLVPVRSIVLPDYYRPPETTLHGASLTKNVDAEKCDTWGIGVITLELLTGGMLLIQSVSRHHFSFNQRNDTLACMLQSTYFCAAVEAAHGEGCSDLMRNLGGVRETTPDITPEIDEAALWIWWVFVTDLLKFDPTIRIGIETAAQHGFMQKTAELLNISTSPTENERIAPPPHIEWVVPFLFCRHSNELKDDAVKDWISSRPQEFYEPGILRLVDHWESCARA